MDDKPRRTRRKKVAAEPAGKPAQKNDPLPQKEKPVAPKVERQQVRPALPKLSFQGKNMLTRPIQCMTDGVTRSLSAPVALSINAVKGDFIEYAGEPYLVAHVLHREDEVKEYVVKSEMVSNAEKFTTSEIQSGRWANRP